MSVQKPRRSFSTAIGGNSAKITSRKVNNQKTETNSVVDEKKETISDKLQKKVTKRIGIKEKAIKSSELKVSDEEPEEKIKNYDFRNLPEPEKTLKRLEAFLLDRRMTHGEHAAGALLILTFKDKPDTQVIQVRQILSDNRGYSGKVRTTLLGNMEKCGLIQRAFHPGVGTEITLLF